MKIKNIVIVLVCSIFIVGCVEPSIPSPFNIKNALSVKTHVHSSEILRTFGPPKSISVDTCGGKTGETWQCTIWRYSDYCYSGNCFTFYTSDRDGELYLNSWNLNNLEK